MNSLQSSLSLSRRCAIPLLCISCATAPLAQAAELGALARRFQWPTQPNNFSTYTKGGAGTVTDTAADDGVSSHAAASFHTLAVACSATGRNNGQSRSPSVGGLAYWFDQITISSPSVPNGTVGTADFTLFFQGKMSTGPSLPFAGTYHAELQYRWVGIAQSDGGNGQPDLGVGALFSRRTDVYSAYTETIGPEFYLNQPNHHQVIFRYGEPFDFTISLSATGRVWDNSPSTMKASLHLTGWNGFHNLLIRDGGAVTDAVIGSQTGFNYGNAGTISFEQWARMFQVGTNSADEDGNRNGIPNLLEYALGRDPLEPGGAGPIIRGSVVAQGVEYPTIVFTRPISGARPGDIQYTPERSTTLGGWSPNGMVMETAPDPNGLQQETVTVRSNEPLGSLDGEWMRLKVTKP